MEERAKKRGFSAFCLLSPHFSRGQNAESPVSSLFPPRKRLLRRLRPGQGHSIVFLGKTWGVKILIVASCCRNRDKLRPSGPHGPVCKLYLRSHLGCTGRVRVKVCVSHISLTFGLDIPFTQCKFKFLKPTILLPDISENVFEISLVH